MKKGKQAVLKQEDSASYLELLSESELPQNSDAVLVLGQHRAAFNAFSNRNTERIGYNDIWITKEWIESRKKEDDDYEEEEEYDEDEDDDNCETEDTSDE